MATLRIYSGIRAMLLLVVCLAIINLSIGKQRFCGSKLRDVVDLMCPNGVNGYRTKRGSLSTDEDLSIENNEEEFNFGLSLDMLPLLTSMDSSEIAKIRRRRHGIAHECCAKDCSPKEVLSYCRRN